MEAIQISLANSNRDRLSWRNIYGLSENLMTVNNGITSTLSSNIDTTDGVTSETEVKVDKYATAMWQWPETYASKCV